jgi:transcriptional regulator with XRE-family HTH domain
MEHLAFESPQPDETQALLAHRIRNIRLAKLWKQDTLAKRSGVSLPTIRRYEATGQTSIKNFLKICFVLGLLDDITSWIIEPKAQSIAELEALEKQKIKKRMRGRN